MASSASGNASSTARAMRVDGRPPRSVRLGGQRSPGAATYQPAVSVDDARQHMVYTGEPGHAYYVSYDGETWSEWQDLGENYAYDPLQHEYDGEHYLAYTGEDGAVYYKTYDAAAAEEGY